MGYRIISGDVTVLAQDEQYIRLLDKTEPLLFGDDFPSGETPYFKGPSSNTWFKCEQIGE
jgi:hypothetical protein